MSEKEKEMETVLELAVMRLASLRETLKTEVQMTEWNVIIDRRMGYGSAIEIERAWSVGHEHGVVIIWSWDYDAQGEQIAKSLVLPFDTIAAVRIVAPLTKEALILKDLITKDLVAKEEDRKP